VARLLKVGNVLGLLLLFVPIALILEFALQLGPTVVFVASALAIIPLAGLMGKATEVLAARVGAGLGGLLNATFGNAAELIIAIFALRAGMHDLVKASLTGSIIGNVLLVFGLCALLGGTRYPRQQFNRMAASLGSTMLLLSAIALVIPALYHQIAGPDAPAGEYTLSLLIAGVLMLCYLLGLLFTLRTHQHLYIGRPTIGEAETDRVGWSPARALGALVGSAALIGLMSERLVGAAEEAAHSLGMNEVFVGVIIVAMIGNAAEHSTAVLMALKNKMDLAIHIAIGSSVQIALFVAPLLVMLSYVIGETPMNLLFTTLEVVAVGIAVIAISQIADDGETHWMEGVLLLAVYLILGFAFYMLPS